MEVNERSASLRNSYSNVGDEDSSVTGFRTFRWIISWSSSSVSSSPIYILRNSFAVIFSMVSEI